MTEIFKTNVQDKRSAGYIITLLNSVCDTYEISFDLEDCEKILRVEARDGLIDTSLIKATLHGEGFYCEVLPE